MKYFKRVNDLDETLAVESYSHSSEVKGAIEIGEAEFLDFLAKMPTPSESLRDLQREIDDLIDRVDDLERRGNG